MNEKIKIINNNIVPNNNNKNINEIYTNFIDYESNKNSSISIDYSIEEKNNLDKTQKCNIVNLENLDVNNLESIRLSLTFGNKDLNPQILLNRIQGIETPNKKQKKTKIKKDINNIKRKLQEKKYEINMINAINTYKGLDCDSNNDKNIMVESEEVYSNQNDSLNIKEYENKDSDKFNIKNNYNMNYNYEHYYKQFI